MVRISLAYLWRRRYSISRNVGRRWVVTTRPSSVASSAVEIEGSAGIVKQLCADIAARRWKLGLSTFASRHQSCRVAADDRESKEAEEEEKRSMAELGQVS